ncbi:hypothetical protein L2E82_06011 [Cichorium intybus]|uniref:Uncharacterized protein n=1 Tax=Cichorium intybus TaxID=13427 RepID=A0ACB9H9E2_CICIN|nr:hypothetical protein L2E82_06011 [Cichorium intybus]
MDQNSWTRFSTSNSALRRYQSRSDETDGDEARPEYLCPFCAEDFDIVGLCCHIDEEHTVQAKNGVCPICAKRVGTGLRRLRKVGSNSTLSILKKELREGNLQSVLGGSSFLVQSSMNTEPDPLLSSFMFNNTSQVSKDQTQTHSVEASNKDFLARSEKEEGGENEEEKIRRSEFVQGLVLSTFFDVDL